jgi:hypothetical protein
MRGEVQMGAMSNSAQSRRYAGLLPVEMSVEELAVYAAELKNERFRNRQPPRGKRASRPLSRFLMTFCIGVAATLAWQQYSEAARQLIASLSPRLGWLAPQAAVAQTIPDTVEQITRNVDRIIATGQEQIMRSVDQLAEDQEQAVREIGKLQAMSQYALSKNTEPPLRPTPARTSKPGTRAVR